MGRGTLKNSEPPAVGRWEVANSRGLGGAPEKGHEACQYPVASYSGKCQGHLVNFEPFFYVQAMGPRKIPIKNLEKLPKVMSNLRICSIDFDP